MTDPFEYDVFISFSSADEKIVKPIWQELCSNGLRVFWSDSNLKKEVGNSWFEVIQKSLVSSRHMLLICSQNSMNSEWVNREYGAFFNYCYSKDSRRLIPLLTPDFSPDELPVFLRAIQARKINGTNVIQEIIPILGGVNIEKLQQELKFLQKQVHLLSAENKSLNENMENEIIKINTLTEENKSLREQNNLLNKATEEQKKLLLSNNASIKKLQQERLSLQENVNSLSSENKSLNENAKTESKNTSTLIEKNKSLKEQLVQLKKQNRSLNETAEEQKKILLSENTALKRQISKLNNSIKFLTEKKTDSKLESPEKLERKNIKEKVFSEDSESVKKNTEEVKSIRTDNDSHSLSNINFNNLNLIKIPSGWYVVFNRNDESLYKKEKNISYDYWIGKTPITYEEFYEFAKANNIPFTIPENKNKHPVIQVSWHEANQFTAWLNTSATTGLPENYIYALPSIEEWEKAAKGSNGYLYPWGNDFNKDYCNTEESNKGDTTPVGYYSPQGDSFYGVSDMIGNVEQWTRSSVKDSSNLIIAIGSSYYSNQNSILKTSVYKYNPNKKFYTCGFRLVAVPSSVLGKTK